MNPTNSYFSRCVTVLAAVGLFVGAACDSSDGAETGLATDGTGAATTDDPGSDADSDSNSNGSSDGSSTGGEGSTGDEETTGPPEGGLGCGITPTCDKGTLTQGIYELTSSDQIEEIAGYTKLSGSLEIKDSDLECLDFLICLEEVGGDIDVYDNQYLKDLSGTNTILDVGTEYDVAGSLVISDNGAVEDMNGFDRLRQTTISLNITRNDAMLDVTGLSGLVAVQKDLTIRDNPELRALSGMHELKAVGGKFVVTQNPNLCITEVAAVGQDLVQGPFGGSTDGNDFDC